MPKASKLFDNFNNNVEDAVKWPNSYDATFATRAETGGTVVITLTTVTPGSNYSGYKSGLYDLVNSYMQVKIPTMVNTDTDAECFLRASIDSNNFVEIKQKGNLIRFSKNVAGVTADVASETYNATNDLYWRIRESQGTTYWDVSSDGDTWVNKASQANPINLDAVYLEFGAGTFQSEVLPGTAVFDDFNFGLSSPANIGRMFSVGNNMSIAGRAL